jgi:membrane protease YdiL (CAAX protease family)
MTAGAALAWTMGASFLMALLNQLLLALHGAEGLDLLSLGGLSAISYLLATFGVLVVHDPDATSLGKSLALRPASPVMMLLGLGLGLGLKLPAEALQDRIERLFPSEPAVLAAREELFRVDSPSRAIQVVVSVCLLAPVVEEIFFRGALFGRLTRHSITFAATLSGLLFVISHGEPRDFPSLILVAAALGLMRVVSGSLGPSMMLHFAFNAVSVLALLSGTAGADAPIPATPVEILASSVLSVALVVVAVRFGRKMGRAALSASAEDDRA